MNKTTTAKLWRRLFALVTLAAALVVVARVDVSTTTFARYDSCQPCMTCTPDTTCYPCGAAARPMDDFCEDGLRAFTCAGVCKSGGDSCPGDMPICTNGMPALCNGGTWDCDVYPNNQCMGSPPYCASGSAFCYGGEWYCANNTGCSGSPPTCCADGSACDSSVNPLLCCPNFNSHSAVCHAGVWRC